ncbi:MAG TPA: HAD-IIIC family phosphatase [Polyangiaceae bacterium]|nr:HAD-IIIC family phosphatase [Polyangiaceae bacterium]
MTPLSELVELLAWASGYDVSLFVGDFDNYVDEALDPKSRLFAFEPECVVLLPSERRCVYQGGFGDPADVQRAAVRNAAEELVRICSTIHEQCGAEVILGNFIPPETFDPGPLRTRSLASDWSFRRAVNLELGLLAPSFVHVCDLELLAARRGLVASRDARRWFESKQPCSPALLPDVAREIVELVGAMRRAPKKVLVLDLDNTLWGGVIGDDGLNGIELGDTSPRGEAFKAFQTYVARLQRRGVLLAVCSKNDEAIAREPFEKHPEMVLRMDDIVSFKASWGPKSDAIRAMAEELNLGLDSFVFVDDNPAEVEIVRQFVPEVHCIVLGPDPSTFVQRLADSRHFDVTAVTSDDAARTRQYRAEASRRASATEATDMDAYLRSLEMEARIREFREIDVPRIAQLINKSNQFNLTTRRRTEAEVAALVGSSRHPAFTIRLSDKFGDHGLIAIVIGEIRETTLHVDTWLMSCRVLKRQVEEETVNEMMRLAARFAAERVVGRFIPTAKNAMVKGLYPDMGFRLTGERDGELEFESDPRAFVPKPTRISVVERSYEQS